MWRDVLSNPEWEFLAETTWISIIPDFRKDKITLMSGSFGPFKPNKNISIPLWLAIQYRKNKKCKIIIPPFLEANFLDTTWQGEKANVGEWIELPPYFFEIAQIWFCHAEDDFLDIKAIRGYVEDLAAIRMEKINKKWSTIKDEDIVFKLDSMNHKEIEQIRPFWNQIFPMRINWYNPKHRNPNENLLFVSANNQEETQSNINETFSQGF